MQRVATFLRLLLLAVLVGGLAAATHAREARYLASITLAELAAEAMHTLRLIQQGGPFPYPHKDGSTFGNFERRLPLQPRGHYREYTVPTPGRRDRGPRRIAAGQGRGRDATNSVAHYYTGDHYRSFRRVRD